MKKTGPPLNTDVPATVFQVGYTCKLKTGGPLMLVKYTIEQAGGQKVLCEWFNGTELNAELFDALMLYLVSPGR